MEILLGILLILATTFFVLVAAVPLYFTFMFTAITLKFMRKTFMRTFHKI